MWNNWFLINKHNSIFDITHIYHNVIDPLTTSHIMLCWLISKRDILNIINIFIIYLWLDRARRGNLQRLNKYALRIANRARIFKIVLYLHEHGADKMNMRIVCFVPSPFLLLHIINNKISCYSSSYYSPCRLVAHAATAHRVQHAEKVKYMEDGARRRHCERIWKKNWW